MMGCSCTELAIVCYGGGWGGGGGYITPVALLPRIRITNSFNVTETKGWIRQR